MTRPVAWRGVSEFLESAVRPASGISDPWERQHARVFSGALLGAIGGLGVTLALSIGFVAMSSNQRLVLLGSVPVMAGLYVLSRAAQYRKVAALAVALMSVGSWLGILVGGDMGDRAVSLPFLVISPAVAALVFSMRVVGLICVVNLAGAIGLLIGHGDVGKSGTGIQSLAFLIISSLLIVIFAWSRGRDEAELEEARVHARRLFDSTFDGVLIEHEGIVVEANESLVALFGAVAPDALIGVGIEELLPGILALRESGAGERFDTVCRRRDGSHFTAEVQSKRWSYRRRGMTLMGIRDVSEERRTADWLALALETGEMGIWGIESDRGRFQMSEALLLLYRLEPGSFDETVESALELIDPADRGVVLEAFADAIERSGDFDVEHRVVTRPGARFWSRGKALTPGREGHGRLIGVTIDVTKRRELEDRVSRSQRLETVEQLAGGIAHEFNNLLTVVSGHAALLRSNLFDGSDLGFNAGQILAASAQAAELIKQLLTFSRREPSRLERLDVGHIVEGSRTLLQHLVGESNRLRIEYANLVPFVQADRSQLQLVLVNLATNARDAMPEGGLLTLRIAELDGDATIVVRDTGAGMTADVLERALEPFFTTKPPGSGTGLGLATVHGIVTDLGGTIDIESQPGRGTTFAIRLPGVGTAAGEEPEAHPEPAYASSGGGDAAEPHEARAEHAGGPSPGACAPSRSGNG